MPLKIPEEEQERENRKPLPNRFASVLDLGGIFTLKGEKETVLTMDSFASPSQTLAALYQVDTQGTIAPIVPGRFG